MNKKTTFETGDQMFTLFSSPSKMGSTSEEWRAFLHAVPLEELPPSDYAADAYVQCTLQKHAEQSGFVPVLIGRLEHEHRLVTNLVSRLQRSIDSHEAHTARELVSELHESLDAHLRKENVFLYKHLFELYAHDDETLEAIHRTRETAKRLFASEKLFHQRYKNVSGDAVLEEMRGALAILDRTLIRQLDYEEEQLFRLYVAN
jgi:hypothetical protein